MCTFLCILIIFRNTEKKNWSQIKDINFCLISFWGEIENFNLVKKTNHIKKVFKAFLLFVSTDGFPKLFPFFSIHTQKREIYLMKRKKRSKWSQPSRAVQDENFPILSPNKWTVYSSSFCWSIVFATFSPSVPLFIPLL